MYKTLRRARARLVCKTTAKTTTMATVFVIIIIIFSRFRVFLFLLRVLYYSVEHANARYNIAAGAATQLAKGKWPTDYARVYVLPPVTRGALSSLPPSLPPSRHSSRPHTAAAFPSLAFKLHTRAQPPLSLAFNNLHTHTRTHSLPLACP